MTCVVVGCESQNTAPVLRVPARHAPGGRRRVSLCRRHQLQVDLGDSWTLSHSGDEIIMNDDPMPEGRAEDSPLFILEDAGAQRQSGHSPDPEEPSVWLQVDGYWPGHDLPETFDVMVTRETASLLRDMLPPPEDWGEVAG